MSSIEETLSRLELIPLPVEGGFFRRVYESNPAVRPDNACRASCIHYAMTAQTHSALHKLSCDELWFYHSGPPAEQILLHPDGRLEMRMLGAELERNQAPLSFVPAGTWQTTRPLTENADTVSLFSTVCIPGYEDANFMPAPEELEAEIRKKRELLFQKIKED